MAWHDTHIAMLWQELQAAVRRLEGENAALRGQAEEAMMVLIWQVLR